VIFSSSFSLFTVEFFSNIYHSQAKDEKLQAKIKDVTPRFGMFSAVHQDPAPSVAEEEKAEEPAEAADSAPVQAVSRATSSLGIPLAAELSVTVHAAEVVKEDDIVTTTPHPEAPPQPWLSQRRNKIILLLILLLVAGIVVAVVIAVGVGVGGDTEDASEDDDTAPVPTESPTTAAPTTLYDRIFTLASGFSGTAILQEETSPQSQALQWSYGDSFSSQWSDDEILERYALTTMYYQLDGGRWTSVTDFLLPSSYCDWDGIQCDDNGKPSNITLVNESLSGSLPPEIGLVSTLKVLNLEGNALTGSLPSQLGLLSNLQELSLPGIQEARTFVTPERRSLEDGIQHNDLSGSIPST
jgi:hypothetical protein